MGEAGAQVCREAGVSWFDLSGNADIRAPGLHFRAEGRPNRFLRRKAGERARPEGGRPSNVNSIAVGRGRAGSAQLRLTGRPPSLVLAKDFFQRPLTVRGK